ncbi:MAG TPA: substrate-binding domain-containing protein [Duganella sp.]|nr:substrate-binding domain-containing protein [Duganella sp.]
MRKWPLVLLLCAICLGGWPLAAFCKELNIVFIPKSRDQDFWTFMRQGVDKAVREDGGVDLTWRGPAHNDDIDSQIDILRLYSRADVDAIIIVPTDRVRLMDPIRKAAALGVKIVVVDSALGGSWHTNFVGTDNHAAGRLAAERMVSLLNGQGTVLVMRTIAGSGSTDDRANGFVNYLAKNAPRIAVVDEYGGGTRGKVSRAGLAALTRHPRIDAVFAVNESASDGMLRALRQTGQAGKIKVIGFDTSDFLLEGLKKREIHGLVLQNPRQMGYRGMKAAIAAARGAPVKERDIVTDAVMVSLENYLRPEIQSLLVP